MVRLNRRNNATMPIGVFRCEIKESDMDPTNSSTIIYVGIYKYLTEDIGIIIILILLDLIG